MSISVPPEGVLVCTQCGFEAFAGDLFCENCSAPLPGVEQSGAQVTTAPGPVLSPSGAPAGVSATLPMAEISPSSACANCGGTAFQDGYCSTCGTPAAKARDHWHEQPAAWVAGVTDRGIRHHRNEDALALSAGSEPGGWAVLVVCDGVSSSMDPDVASLAAARAAREVLNGSRPSQSQPAPGSVAGRISAATQALTEAGAAANAMVVDTWKNPTQRPGERQNSPPSCTFVAAVVDGPVLVIGWVGDSRGYWVPDQGPAEILSVDDSWASEAIAAGMPRAAAETAPQAHAITRWLGVDSPDPTPRCVSITPSGPGWLVVCSDGLWNYCSTAADLAAVVGAAATDNAGEPLATAAALTDWANAQGGMDNITVALARVDPRPGG